MILILLLPLVLFLVYLANTFHYKRHWKENFEVQVAFSEDQAGVGDTLFLYETAINKKKMKLPAICVKFRTSKYLRFEDTESGTVSDYFYRNDVMSVDGFEKVRRKLRFTCKKRGMYHIDEAELVSYDLFCRQTFVHRIPVAASLCVYPPLINVEKLIPVFRHMTGGYRTNLTLFEDPFAFAGVREYTSQDSMRRIHWKASARMGSWQVKTTEYNASTSVVILLNLESPGVFTPVELLEDSISLAYSFVFYLCSNGVQTRLAAAGDEMLRLEENGRHQISAVRRALALISYENPCCRGEELVRREIPRLRRDDHVIVISMAGKQPMQEAVMDMMKAAEYVTWVAPVISEQGEDNEFRELSPSIARCLVKWGGLG